MTREEVVLRHAKPLLGELRRLDVEWHLAGPDDMEVKMVRTTGGCCPLVALARARGKYLTNKTDIEILGDAVGIDPGVAGAIVDAADGTKGITAAEGEEAFIFDPDLREALLDAVGLS